MSKTHMKYLSQLVTMWYSRIYDDYHFHKIIHSSGFFFFNYYYFIFNECMVKGMLLHAFIRKVSTLLIH